MAAGSYNNWGNLLARFAGYPESPIVQYDRLEYRYDAGAWLEESGDFIELINFSDCEGTIGTELCEKLYTDFMNNLDILENDKNYDVNFKTKYRGWFRLLGNPLF